MTASLRNSIAFCILAGLGAALSGCAAVDDALDPNCTADKSARNVAMQSTVGVGNRCGPGETVRDMTGTDGMVENAQDRLP